MLAEVSILVSDCGLAKYYYSVFTNHRVSCPIGVRKYYPVYMYSRYTYICANTVTINYDYSTTPLAQSLAPGALTMYHSYLTTS